MHPKSMNQLNQTYIANLTQHYPVGSVIWWDPLFGGIRFLVLNKSIRYIPRLDLCVFMNYIMRCDNIQLLYNLYVFGRWSWNFETKLGR